MGGSAEGRAAAKGAVTKGPCRREGAVLLQRVSSQRGRAAEGGPRCCKEGCHKGVALLHGVSP